jgi:hypothetical protein
MAESAGAEEIETDAVETEELESELEEISDDEDVELPVPGAPPEEEEESEW